MFADFARSWPERQIRGGALRSSASFRGNKRGNVAVMSAVSALPMIAGVGCVIDYTTA